MVKNGNCGGTTLYTLLPIPHKLQGKIFHQRIVCQIVISLAEQQFRIHFVVQHQSRAVVTATSGYFWEHVIFVNRMALTRRVMMRVTITSYTQSVNEKILLFAFQTLRP